MRFPIPRTAGVPVVLAVIIGSALILSSCSMQRISSYDPQTDQQVTALYKKMERFFLTLTREAGTPQCGYSFHQDFYPEVMIEASSLALRARATPNNELSVQQIELLQSSLQQLEQLHRLSCLSPAQIQSLRSNFNSSFGAILKLELAKKREQP